MTPEKLAQEWEAAEARQKAAWCAEITGWTLEGTMWLDGHGEWTEYYDMESVDPDAKCLCEYWQPHCYRNQAALVVAKIEQLGLWREWICRLHLHPVERALPLAIPGNYNDETLILHRDIHLTATASADARCCAAWTAWMMAKEHGDDAHK